MGFDFPSSPSDGQVFWPWGGAPAWVYGSGRWARRAGMADRRNRIVNPSMQVSQQNGMTYSTGSNVHLADQFVSSVYWPTGSVASTRYQETTPGGSKYRIAYSVLGAGAADYGYAVQFGTNIEGSRITDFNYGSTFGKWSVLRFGWRSPAGTYCFVITNSSFARTLVSPFTVSPGQANTDLLFTIAIPPDITGTWEKTNLVGARLYWVVAYYPLDVVAANTWLDVPAISHTSMSNTFMNTVGNEVSLFDVGLYLDPNITGLPPPFEVPLYEDDLRDCQRYWYRAYGMRGLTTGTTTNMSISAPHPVPMRVSPAVALVGSGLRVYDGTTLPTATSASASVAIDDLRVSCALPTSGAVLGRVNGPLVDAQTANYIAVSARM